jgi:prevent-host-death family protein
VSATEAVRKFSSIVAQVREKGAVYVVEKSGKPVARIGPAAKRSLNGREFAALVRARAGAEGDSARTGHAYGRAVEDGITFLNRSEVPKTPWAY